MDPMAKFPTKRLRRLRYNATLREMLAEVRLCKDELIAPLFVREGTAITKEIPSMPDQFQYSVDTAIETVARWADKGLRAVLLFGIPDQKDPQGSKAWDEKAGVQRLCREIKKRFEEIVVITDVCLCEYTDHGHCGPVVSSPKGKAEVDNDAALELLAKVAISHAKSGADIVAPSAMMDGQVAAIRQALDDKELKTTAIMSYAVKFASSLYGPFRDAAESNMQFGDRKSYQMDYRSPSQACPEAAADLEEGADIFMVKPALPYLDIISKIRQKFDAPLAAYNISGEYSMIKAAANAGWIDEKTTVLEVTSAIKRSGADLIITYFAEQLADWL